MTRTSNIAPRRREPISADSTATVRIGGSTVKIWEERGFWKASVNGRLVEGREQSRVKAIGNAVLRVLLSDGVTRGGEKRKLRVAR